jgi:TPR repeat protein
MHMSSHRHGLALCFFERAIRPPLQHAESHAMLSWMLQHGRDGVSVQHDLAHNLARQGALLGCEHSQGALAHCLLNGWGVAKNIAAALKLARESGAKGSYMGQYVLAIASVQVYVSSVHNNESTLLGVLQNLKLASDQGLPEARFGYAIALITFFTDMESVQRGKVYKQAMRLYEQAAFGGVVAAQESLKPMHEIDQRIHLAADFKAFADLMRASASANSWSQTLANVISKVALQTIAGVIHLKPAKPVITAAANSIAEKFTSQGRFLSSLVLAASDGLPAQSAGHANLEVEQRSSEQPGAAIPAIISRLGKLLGSQYCPACNLDATIGSKCTVSGDYHMKMR